MKSSFKKTKKLLCIYLKKNQSENERKLEWKKWKREETTFEYFDKCAKTSGEKIGNLDNFMRSEKWGWEIWIKNKPNTGTVRQELQYTPMNDLEYHKTIQKAKIQIHNGRMDGRTDCRAEKDRKRTENGEKCI